MTSMLSRSSSPPVLEISDSNSSNDCNHVSNENENNSKSSFGSLGAQNSSTLGNRTCGTEEKETTAQGQTEPDSQSETSTQKSVTTPAGEGSEDTLELKKLSLDQHGTFMVDFDPERSQREMRKMNRRLHTKESKKNQAYDSQGILLENGLDLCDCLDKDCPGCHFPCPRCNSAKCGSDCRSNRRYIIDFIEVEGMDSMYSFPTS
ncbi:ARL14 effector protein-like [Aplysia californica]|uniref:ARL14 effector protein-like n=1 Tax=Aplysia californica TaxID=6500 RepID=A0ABM0JLJ2_APLCA|nr:ARL14 effector protein-like [Aplysia californica]